MFWQDSTDWLSEAYSDDVALQRERDLEAGSAIDERVDLLLSEESDEQTDRVLVFDVLADLDADVLRFRLEAEFVHRDYWLILSLSPLAI